MSPKLPKGLPWLPMIGELDLYAQKTYMAIVRIALKEGIEDEHGVYIHAGRKKISRESGVNWSRTEQAIYKLEGMGFIERVRENDKKQGCMYRNYRMYVLTIKRGKRIERFYTKEERERLKRSETVQREE